MPLAYALAVEDELAKRRDVYISRALLMSKPPYRVGGRHERQTLWTRAKAFLALAMQPILAAI